MVLIYCVPSLADGSQYIALISCVSNNGVVEMKKLINVMIASVLLTVSGSLLADGQKTYQTTCQACHATGAANAPKLGDKAA